MAQRKHKTNNQQNQKLEQIKYRKEFLMRLKYFVNLLSGEDVYSDIPTYVIDNLYQIRAHALKIVFPPALKIPHADQQIKKSVLFKAIKEDTITISPNGLTMNIEEFFTIGLTINILHESLVNTHKPWAIQIKAGINEFVDAINEYYKQANLRLDIHLLILTISVNRINKRLYWYKHEIITATDLTPGVQNIVTLYSGELETTTAKIDGHVRPVKRLGWALPYRGIELVSLPPSQLNINSPFADTTSPVYVQSHALNRLSERIDCLDIGVIHYNLYLSLSKPTVCKDHNNRILVEYRLFSFKAGYLVVDWVNGMMVVRTFLFITSNSTPEGQKLNNHTGLQKLDKQYLIIDKLSSFMSSDIGSNPDVYSIFKTAGCLSLIEMYQVIKELINTPKSRANPLVLLDYLNRDGNCPEPADITCYQRNCECPQIIDEA